MFCFLIFNFICEYFEKICQTKFLANKIKLTVEFKKFNFSYKNKWRGIYKSIPPIYKLLPPFRVSKPYNHISKPPIYISIPPIYFSKPQLLKILNLYIYWKVMNKI